MLNELLMWVGTKSYPTIDAFVKEARRQGVCKRIGKVLTAVTLGQTKIYLAHDEGLVGNGFIFGYFIAARMEVLVEDLTKLPPHCSEQCTPVEVSSARLEQERGCGWREVPNSIYLASETNVDNLREIARREGIKRSTIKGGFVAIPPVQYLGRRFRGVLAVDGKTLLEANPAIIPSIEYPKPNTKLKWTKVDENKLRKLILNAITPRARIITQYALDSGHERSRVQYYYSKMGI